MAANTKQQAPTNLDVLWQEMEHLKRLNTDLASQVQRVRRFARVDELEAVSGKLEQESLLIQQMGELSRAVSVLADVRQSEMSVDEMGQQVHRENQATRRRQTSRSLAHYRYLSTLTQVMTERCPCGKHRGIQFRTAEDKVIEENYCPQWWWVAMSRMSFESGKHREFHRRAPLIKWLGKYALKAQESPNIRA